MEWDIFKPNLTPKEIIRMGSFGGTYFHPTHRGIDIHFREFPNDWFEGLEIQFYYSKRYNPKINYYKIKSGQSQEEWERMGWINPIDPRGWFQWYCRYYMGRRCEDDGRQIKRWVNFCGENGRWKNNIYLQIYKRGGDLDDESYGRGVRQSLMHWGYKVNQKDYHMWKFKTTKENKCGE